MIRDKPICLYCPIFGKELQEKDSIFYSLCATLFKRNLEERTMEIRKMQEQYLLFCKYRKELNDKTLKAYRIDLRQYFEWVEGEEPGKAEIEEFITKLHINFKQKTVKRKLASIKAFYNYLEEEELIEENPFRKIKVKFKEAVVLPRIIPREEIEILLNYMYAHRPHSGRKTVETWRRDIAIVEMFFATGARVYEISNIRTECVDLQSGLICFKGKGNKERYVQIGNQEVLEWMREYYSENQKEIEDCGFFFLNNRGTRFTEQSIRLMLKKYTKAAGIRRNITPHMFRHFFATYLIEEGVDVSCIQQILGHSSIKTTQIYIHVAVRKQAEILQQYHPRNFMKIKVA